MSDQLTASPDTPGATSPVSRSRGWRGPVLEAIVVIVAFAVVGAACGLIWEALWNPAPGEVVKHVWYPISWDRAQPDQFAAVGLFVIVGVVAGAVLGALAAWRLDRAELVTLAAVVVGGALAAYLMREVGLHRSPPDPQHLAKTAADGTKLPSSLPAPGWGLLAAFPGGGLAGLAIVFLTVTKRPKQE